VGRIKVLVAPNLELIVSSAMNPRTQEIVRTGRL
jgi:hypothetical protein